MKSVVVLIVLVTVAGHQTSAWPVSHSLLPEEARIAKATDIKYRLPDEFDPIEYRLSITPRLPPSTDPFTFDGEVVIAMKPKIANASKITLHAKNLDIKIRDIKINNNIDVLEIVQEKNYDFFHIHLNNELVNTNLVYEVTIKYKGLISEDMKGFYRSYYKQGNETKWMATTQMQPVHARTVFPCFDEPKFKAVFKLTIKRASTFKMSLSNMPGTTTVEGGMMVDVFKPTPKMSTYLLAFIISEFEPAMQDANKTFGVWARPGAKSMGKFAYDTGVDIVTKMSAWMGIPYYGMAPEMKMDQAAIPDFSAGAMENWGLLTYREAYLMIDDAESSARYRQQVAGILAHEIAHMWFGDYVTCEWWGSTWLNEGFARFFQYKLPDVVDPSYSMFSHQFTAAQVHTAMQADTGVGSVPLTNPNVNSPEEIGDFFGTISYNKGASVIRMINHWLGDATFQKGLTRYMNVRKYSTSTQKDLFDALQAQADQDNVTLEKKVDVVFQSWTNQPGYPLVTVNVDHDTGKMSVTQQRFVREGQTSPDTLYEIPLTYTTRNKSDFTDTKTHMIFNTHSVILDKGSKDHEWVIFNKQQVGFYRVNYDDHTWMMLSKSLQTDERTKIHTLNRAQIVDDVFNFAREKLISYSTMFDVIQFLESESDYAPWTAAYAGFSFIRQRFAHTPAIDMIHQHMSNLMKTVTGTVGLAEVNQDPHLNKLFRANTLSIACQIGHEACRSDSISLFAKLMQNNTKVNPNLREHVYCNALRFGADRDFDFLWKKYGEENVVNEQVVILGALGCTSIASKLKLYLEQTLTTDSGIRKQDQMTAFNAALTGNPKNVETVFEFIKDNISGMKVAYGSANFMTAMNNLASRMNSAHLIELQEFVKTSTNLSDAEKTSVNAAITRSREALMWADKNKDDIISWVNKKYNGASSVSMSIALLVFSLISLFINQ